VLKLGNMDNAWEIAGISLQIAAGLVFILDQVAHKFSASVEGWFEKVLDFLSGQGKRRWRIFILTSIFALPAILIIIFVGTNNEITWSAIGGLLFFTLLGFDLYAIALSQFGGRFTRNDWNKKIDVSLNERLRILINERKMLSSNVKLLIITSVCLVVFYLVLFYLYPYSNQNLILQFLLLAIIGFISLVLVPIFLFSLAFVIVEGLLHLIPLLKKIDSKYYWIAILVTWLTGGAFLLVNAICK